MFGPQKGATPEEEDVLEEAMSVLAERIESDLGLDVAEIPGAGAGGGMGAGLIAFFGARLQSGFDLVAEATGLAHAASGAQLVVTGEGRLDSQSLRGKATIGVARLARAAHVPSVVIAGSIELSDRELVDNGFRDWQELKEQRVSGAADAAGALREAARELALRFSSGP